MERKRMELLHSSFHCPPPSIPHRDDTILGFCSSQIMSYNMVIVVVVLILFLILLEPLISLKPVVHRRLGAVPRSTRRAAVTRVLPRIPVKPDSRKRNGTTTTHRGRPPLTMGWCDYVRELGIAEAKCGAPKNGGERKKLKPEGGANTGDGPSGRGTPDGDRKTDRKKSKPDAKPNKKQRKKKERILIEFEKTVEEEDLDKEEEEEARRQKQLIKVVEEVRRRMDEQRRDAEEYTIEGVGNFPSCSGGLFERCRTSRQCASGALCRARLGDQRPCCRAHSDAQCPSTEQMAYTCLQRNPVNWCNVNADCATNAFRSHICCPTGCGYNVCLSNVAQPPTRRLIQMEARTRHLSPDCPSPFVIRIKCVAPRPTSWCHSARECPTYTPAFPRRCCLTPCGYNVCMTKFGDEGWLIA